MSIDSYIDGKYSIEIAYPEPDAKADVIITVRNSTEWARAKIRMSPIGFAPFGTVRMLIAQIERTKRRICETFLDEGMGI